MIGSHNKKEECQRISTYSQNNLTSPRLTKCIQLVHSHIIEQQQHFYARSQAEMHLKSTRPRPPLGNHTFSLDCLFGLWGPLTRPPRCIIHIHMTLPFARAALIGFWPKSGGVIGAVVGHSSHYVSVTVSDPVRGSHWLTHFTWLARPVCRAALRLGVLVVHTTLSVRHWNCVSSAASLAAEMLIRRSRLPPPPGGARISNFPGLILLGKTLLAGLGRAARWFMGIKRFVGDCGLIVRGNKTSG